MIMPWSMKKRLARVSAAAYEKHHAERVKSQGRCLKAAGYIAQEDEGKGRRRVSQVVCHAGR